MRLEEVLEFSPSSIIIEEDDEPIINRKCSDCINWHVSSDKKRSYCGLYAAANVPMPASTDANNCIYYDTGYDEF